ncbi:MAG: hypothetical protein OEZ22_11440 [Spirochaetia bacterium]|nr:hypothetical protein [Spirochaetia bacterium]
MKWFFLIVISIETNQVPVREGFLLVASRAKIEVDLRKLFMINRAADINDLKAPPRNKLEIFIREKFYVKNLCFR